MNPFHVLSWSGNNTRELCCILRSCRLYYQPNCRLYCTLNCHCYSCYSFCFSFLSHSFTARMHAPSLSLAHSHLMHLMHTHLTHCPIPARGYATLTTMATADAGDLSTELEPPPLSLKSPLWKYFGFPVSYVDNVGVVNKKATVCKLCRN